MVEGQTRYSVDLIADSFAIIAKTKIKTVEEVMQDRPSSGAGFAARPSNGMNIV